MKWSAMNKEQRQKVVLAALAGAAVLYAIYQFVLTPLLDGIDADIARRETLVAKMDKGQRAIRSEAQIDAETKSLQASLEHTFADLLPPLDDALSWATKFVNGHTRRLGLADPSISEFSSNEQAWMSADQAGRIFRPYGIRVELSASFEEIKKLVRSLHDENPYLTVVGVMIAADGRTPEKHVVELQLEWPAWKDAKVARQPFVVSEVPVKDKENAKAP